jgi:hypothetical protein
VSWQYPIKIHYNSMPSSLRINNFDCKYLHYVMSIPAITYFDIDNYLLLLDKEQLGFTPNINLSVAILLLR